MSAPDGGFAALRAALAGFPAPLAIVDADGLLRATNAAWRQAEVNNGGWDEESGPRRYLDVCAAADGPDAGDAFASAQGLGAVLAGASPRFVMPYRCRSSLEERCFQLIVSALPAPLGGALIMHQELPVPAPPGGADDLQLPAGAGPGAAPLQLLEQAPVLLWFADAQGRCRWFNRRWHDYAGTIPGAPDEAAWGLLHPDDGPPGPGGMAADLFARHAGTRVIRLRRHDGIYRAMLATAVPLGDGPGEAGWLGSCTDISEILDAEAELQRQGERLQRELHFAAALNRLSQLIGGLGERDQLLQALSPLLGRALGLDRSLVFDVDLSRREALGLSEWLNPACPAATTVRADYPLALFPESLRHLWEMRIPLESHRDQPNPRLESEGSSAMLHDGMEIHSLLWHPIDFRSDGFLLMVFNQVSQRRIWQAEERRFLDAVANLVTLALQRIRITDEHRGSHERRRLGERMAAMAQVASCASLDLERTLTAMSQAVDGLAGDSAERGTQLRLLQQAIAGARQTSAQLLALGRCRAQRAQPLAAAAVLERLHKAVEELPGPRGSCTLQEEACAIHLRADPALLDQALRALAVHLHRALPAAGALTITAARRTLDPAAARKLALEAGDYLAIAIHGPPRGPALPGVEQALDALTASQAAEGDPDLGLIAAAALITGMEGGLAAGESGGQRTALTAYLPVAQVADAGHAATPLRLPARGGRETVLLVEDDPALLGLVGDSLRHLGYQVLAASSGAEALRVAERHAGGLDLLLTDVVLPQLGGHALAAQLVQQRKDLRVVLMSGFPADAFSAQREFAHTAFLAKPFTIDELVRTVRSALDAGRTAVG